MSVLWHEDGASGIVVEQRGSWVVRLFGVPFLVVGGYFAYQLGDGVWNRDLTVAGVIGLPLIAACFLVPGWIMSFARKRTRLDLGAREATEELGFLVFRRRKTHTVPPAATVQVRYELRRIDSARNRTHLFCPVELELGPRERVLLAEFDGAEADEALLLARRVGALFGIRVHDRRQKEGEPIEEVGAGEDP